MSRRTGQDGHIEASGKWWVVRWWMDVAGQEARRHMRAKVCPISGARRLSKSERERRAREIVAESGADTLEHFDKVVKQAQGVTFREQTKWWFDHIQRRKRKPIAPATLELWKGCLEKWINPNIGDLRLSEVKQQRAQSTCRQDVGPWFVPEDDNRQLRSRRKDGRCVCCR